MVKLSHLFLLIVVVLGVSVANSAHASYNRIECEDYVNDSCTFEGFSYIQSTTYLGYYPQTSTVYSSSSIGSYFTNNINRISATSTEWTLFNLGDGNFNYIQLPPILIPNLQATSTYQTRIVESEFTSSISYARNGSGSEQQNLIYISAIIPDSVFEDWTSGYYAIYFDDLEQGFVRGCFETGIDLYSAGPYELPVGANIASVGILGYAEIDCAEGDVNESIEYEQNLFEDSFVVTSGTTTSTQAVWKTLLNFDTEYFINLAEINASVSERNPTQIKYSISKVPGTEIESYSISFDNQINGTSSVQYSQFFTDGVYEILTKFSNIGCTLGQSSCPFPLSYLYTTVTIQNGSVTAQTTETYNNLNPPSLSNEYEDCALSNVSGCINNSIRFLFIPSDESVNSLLTIKNDLDSRIPFIYLSEITDVIDEVFNTEATESFDLTVDLGFGEITIISREMIEAVPFVNLLNSIIAGMLWVAFATGMYRLVLGIHNRETT